MRRSKSLLVLALNPCLDAEWRVDHVLWEEKNSVLEERQWAGGKGVNVARWLRHLGVRLRLLMPVGGPTGAEVRRWLQKERIGLSVEPVAGTTRVNVLITDPARGQLRFNQPGPRLSADERAGLERRVRRGLHRSAAMVVSGSLPRGFPASACTRLVQVANHGGVRTLVDCAGAELADVIQARPFLVKPNQFELEEWFGRRLSHEPLVRAAARAMSEATGNWVFLSRGAQGGLLVNCGFGVELEGRAPPLKARNTLGAGDALLAAAAWQIQQGADPVDWLRWGIAAGSAATQEPAGRLPSQAALRRLARRVRISGCSPSPGWRAGVPGRGASHQRDASPPFGRGRVARTAKPLPLKERLPRGRTAADPRAA